MLAPPITKLLARALGSVLLLAAVGGAAYGLYRYKQAQNEAAMQAAAGMPEPAEAIEAARVELRPYTKTSTAIGTVRALRYVTLRNELAGTVRKVEIRTGQLVDTNELLIELDIAVEQAQVNAQRADLNLAESMLGRMERASKSNGASAADVDRARAQRDRALAEVQRLKAVIERKRLRAQFPARVGFVDLHPGQYLDPGARITTLQGLDPAVHIDFAVTQLVASHLEPGRTIQVELAPNTPRVEAKILALDAQVDTNTRNTRVRAELRGVDPLPRPGSSVRVSVPVSAERRIPAVPVSALRRSPAGNSVFVIEPDAEGKLRAHMRRVESGVSIGDEVLIKSGLEVGEQVAAAGSFKLREGVLVMTAPSTNISAGSNSAGSDSAGNDSAGNDSAGSVSPGSNSPGNAADKDAVPASAGHGQDPPR